MEGWVKEIVIEDGVKTWRYRKVFGNRRISQFPEGLKWPIRPSVYPQETIIII